MFTARDFVWMLIVPGVIGLVLSIVGAIFKSRVELRRWPLRSLF